MKLLKYVFALILAIVIISTFYLLINSLLILIIPFVVGKFWVIFLYFLFGKIVMSLISWLSIFIRGIILRVTKNNSFNQWLLTLTCLIMTIYCIVIMWTLDIDYKGAVKIVALIHSYLIVNVSWHFIIGIFIDKDKL